MARKVNYLNNKDMLLEIHRSKATFCSYIAPEHADFDIILPSVDKINIRTIAEAKRNKAKLQGSRAYEAAKAAGKPTREPVPNGVFKEEVDKKNNKRLFDISLEEAEKEKLDGNMYVPRKDANGNPTGIFNETAKGLIGKYIPKNDAKRDQMAFEEAVNECLTKGVTSFHDAGVNLNTIKLYKRNLADPISSRSSSTAAVISSRSSQDPYKRFFLTPVHSYAL